MKKITKAEFKKLHSSKAIGLFASAFNHTKDACAAKVKAYTGEVKLLPLSRYDIDNYGDIIKTSIYKANGYIFVESVTDNREDYRTSRDDIRTDTVIYKVI